MSEIGTRPDRWNRAALAVALAAAATTGLFVARIVFGILSEPSIAQEELEANLYFGAEALRNGGGLASVYPASWSEYPLIVTPYPPVFHLLWVGVAWLLGDESSYLPGRIVAVAGLASCLPLIYAISRQLGASRLAACVFAIVFLAPVPVAKWAGIARVDVPGLAFTLLGFYMYLRLREGPAYLVLWSAVPFVIAGLTKQSFVAAPAAAILAELMERRWKRGLLLALAVGGPVLALFGLLDLLTGGGFVTATFGSLTKEVYYLVGFGLTGDFMLTFPIPAALLLLALVPLAVRRSPHLPSLLYLCTAVLVAMLTVGKPGANVNYFIEPMAALCIAAAAGFAALRQTELSVRPLAAPAVAVSFVWLTLEAVPDYHAAYLQHRDRRQDHRPGIQLPPTALSGGPILAPPSTYTLLPEPRPVYYMNDDFTFSVMAARGKFPRDRILNDLRERRIAAVVAYRTAFTDRPAFIGDWQGGWTIWSLAGYREALLGSYRLVDWRLPRGLVLFLPRETDVDGDTPPPADASAAQH